jgi:hypothetical protein
LIFRDEYPDLVDDPRAVALAQGTFMIEEFLLGLHQRGALNLPFGNGAKSFLLHGHCHQKALIGSGPSLQVLRLLPGANVEEVDSGCCGMAGSFGYEKEHYELSIAIGNRRLFPAVKAKGPEWEIVAAGVSCRQQIPHGTGRRARHPAERGPGRRAPLGRTAPARWGPWGEDEKHHLTLPHLAWFNRGVFPLPIPHTQGGSHHVGGCLYREARGEGARFRTHHLRAN